MNAEVVERVRTLAEEGKWVKDIREALEAEGYLSPQTGKPYAKSTVSSCLAELGLTADRRSRDAAARERAVVLLNEGMPVVWVAEDTGLGEAAVYRIARSIPNRRQNVHTWNMMWGGIKKHVDTLRLHQEFAPKKTA